ncbi:MAG: phosphodiesterase [Alphaproteobacteria bacterium]|nr:phosphodiesterase [Alphaproteobacteria bacterium]MCB9928405.1 phosphodiesterase [Alphaproteobacteria bacterium]
MIIAQISDSHIEAPGVLTYGTFDAAASLARVVEALNACDPQPDLVIHTGDLVHHGDAAQYPPAREILAGLKAPLVAIPGNHDSREGFAAAFADAPWLPAGGPFLHFTVEDAGPLRLVCLDTVVPGQPYGALCADRLAWLEAQLAAAPERPTVVACHHPPFATGLTGTTKVGLDRGGPEFAAILSRHPQVQRLICGHSHRPIVGTFGGRPVWVAPATCYQFEAGFSAVNTLALTREPPGYSLHRWLDDPVQGPSLASHHIPVGDFGRPMVLLKDGKRV